MEKGKSEQKNSFSNKGRVLRGNVVSVKMKDTVVVAVQSYVKHSKYGKYLRHTKRYKAHDKGNVCKLGDGILIQETKPISKDKHFTVIKNENLKVNNEKIGEKSEKNEIMEESGSL